MYVELESERIVTHTVKLLSIVAGLGLCREPNSLDSLLNSAHAGVEEDSNLWST
jgi:hypothetical protein